MRLRTGVLPRDLKHFPPTTRSKLNREDLKELAWTILAPLFMVLIVVWFFILATVTVPEPTAPEPLTRKGNDTHAGAHPDTGINREDAHEP